MMKFALKSIVSTLFFFFSVSAFSADTPDISLKTLGVTADGKTINTQAIQAAIDHASAQGGGTLIFEPGIYLTGPLLLKSHVTLQLNKGSTLKAVPDPALFKAAFIAAAAQPGEALILADHAEYVGITGEGTIDGNGPVWWKEAMEVRHHVRSGDTAYFTERFPGIPVANGMPRPWLIEFNNVNHGTIGAVHVTQSPMWNVVIRNSSNIDIDGLHIKNPPDSPNTDGIDIVSSQKMTLKNLDISTGDDNIAIKSGLPGVSILKKPSSKITISDSVFREGHGLSVGSETAHGINNITISNVNFIGTENGIRIKSARDRGGDIFHIIVNDVTMDQVNTPITITDHYTGQGGSDKATSSLPVIADSKQSLTTPYIHDIQINNLTATHAQTAGVLYGLPESFIRNIAFNHIQIEAQTNGFLMAYVHGRIDNTIVRGLDTPSFNRGPKTFVMINGKNR